MDDKQPVDDEPYPTIGTVQQVGHNPVHPGGPMHHENEHPYGGTVPDDYPDGPGHHETAPVKP